MKFKKLVKRELAVAFSKQGQPVLFRIIKYVVLITLVCFFWRSPLFWIILGIVFLLSLLLHFWYRYKTKGWTKSFGGWDYDKNNPDLNT